VVESEDDDAWRLVGDTVDSSIDVEIAIVVVVIVVVTTSVKVVVGA